jgi:CheY-like chemotaxis protein
VPETLNQGTPDLTLGNEITILVVEDDETTRTAMVDSLEMLNYRLVAAADGQTALAILDSHADEIALVLSDVVMPEMGGLELLRALRLRGRDIPVIMITGHLLDKDIELLRREGMRDWLPKPPNLTQLAEMVAKTLEESRTVR